MPELVIDPISVTLTGKVIDKIVKLYSDTIKEPSRFEGLLKDIYGSENKKEIFLLTTALKAKIIEHFELPGNTNDNKKAIDNMIKKLTYEFGLEEKYSAWATYAWAIGLSKLTEEEYKEIVDLSNEIKRNEKLKNTDHDYFFGKRKKIQQDPSIEILNSDSLNPLDITEVNYKGLSLHNQGKYLEAINCYNQALSLDPNNKFIRVRKIQSEESSKMTNIRIDINNNNKKGNSVLTGQTNKHLKSKSFLFGSAIIIILTSIGIGGFFVLNNNNPDLFNLSNSSNKITSSSENHNTPEQTNADDIGKKSLSDFANIIESEINKGNNSTSNKVFSPEVSDISVLPFTPDSKVERENSIDENQQVDQFKLELENSMDVDFK